MIALRRCISPALSLRLTIEPLPLKTPFRIAGHVFASMPALVAVVDDGDYRGRGEASGVYYLGDTPERMRAQLEALRGLIEAGIDRAALPALLPAGGARNALDCALWELHARRNATSVAAMAGIHEPRALLTTFTFGADDPAAIAAAASAAPSSQARAFKLKLDGDVDTDIARVRALRCARPDVWLGVDANQAYTTATLDRLVGTLVDEDVSLLEQPLARGDEAALERFDCPIDIAADESVQDRNDLEALVGRFDVVNIKLDKCGGLTEALAMFAQARALGLRTMVGNMLGTSWAAAPAFVVAQHCDIVDLDGPTFLAQDRTPAVVYHDGRIHCPNAVWGSR